MMKRIVSILLSGLWVCAFCLSTWAAPRKPASVKLAEEGLTLHITFEDGGKLKVTSKGTPLKAGTYWVKSLRFYRKDEKGRRWEMRSTGRLGGMKTLTVAAGQEKVIQPGPSFQLRTWARQGKGDASHTVPISMTVLGQYDAAYYPGAFLRGKRPPAPVFRISDENGRIVQQGHLKVEGGVTCRYTWQVPRGARGSFKLEIRPTLGPFEWGPKAKTIEIE